MGKREIKIEKGKPYGYDRYTIMPFSNWRALESFAKYIEENYPSTKINKANDDFRAWVNQELINSASNPDNGYGMFGQQPKSFEEAMERNTFLPLYYQEYEKVKKRIERKVQEELQKMSVVQAMKPKLVYNDKAIGEFVFEKAAMSLVPNIFFYSPSKKRQINTNEEQIIYEGKKMFLASDKSLVVNAIKITKDNGEEEFIESKGDETLKEATKKGILSVSSTNKKVYLYKEKKPKMYKGVKIIVGMTKGGWTFWQNDFYTGMTAVALADILESLDYSVAIEVVMGGGRCDQVCGGYPLNFNGVKSKGRRYFSFTAKSFDDQMDLDGILYTLADPSFHNIKFISLLNYFFGFFGDTLNPFDDPLRYWHGIEDSDMVNPIGMYHKLIDMKTGNENLMHFYLHRVANEREALAAILDIVRDAENKNKEALTKYANYDFGDNQ